MTSSTSNTAVFATLMKGMNTDKLSDLGVTEEQLAAVMSSFQKSTVSGTDKPERVRKEVDPDDRCMARTWGSKKNENEGHGPQCSAKRCGGDYCKSHAKKAAETETPCTWKEGKKFGLFMGRFDQPLTGKDTDGKWQIFWLTPEVKALVDADKEAGTFVLGENELKHKTKSSGPRKPRVKKDPSEKKTKGAKKEKTPKAPRGKNAYMWFAGTVRAQFKTEIEAAAGLEGATEEDKAKVSVKGTAKVSEVAKLTGVAWAALGAEEKKPFEQQAAADKATKLAAFEDTQLVEKAAEITVTEHDKAALKALVTPASPPKAPDTATAEASQDQIFSDDEEAEADAEELLEQMAEEVDAQEDELDEEGPWQFEVPEEQALTGVEDATDGIAAKLTNGTIVVVSREWYDDAPEEIPDDHYEGNMVGTLTDVTYPEEGGFIEGTFTPKA
jgi:hypothetical protein